MRVENLTSTPFPAARCRSQDCETTKPDMFRRVLRSGVSMSKKHFRRGRICKAALPDVTIRIPPTPPSPEAWEKGVGGMRASPAAREKGVGRMRASRRRRYSEKALPVVTPTAFLTSGERPFICRVFSTHEFVGCVT